jgi:hypothetical protein
MANLNLNFYDKSGNPLNFEYIGPTGPTSLDSKFVYTLTVGSPYAGNLDIVEYSDHYEFNFNLNDSNGYNITQWANEVNDFITSGATVNLNGAVLGAQNFTGAINSVIQSSNGFVVTINKSGYSGQSIISNGNRIYFTTSYINRPGGYFKGNIYFDPVSVGLFENQQIFVVQEFHNIDDNTNVYGLPHTINKDSSNPPKWRTRWFNNNYGETDITDIIFTYVIDDMVDGGAGEPMIVNYPNIVMQVDKYSGDSLVDGLVWCESDYINSQALSINVAAGAPDGADNVYERKLIVEDITTGTPQKVIEIDLYCQIIGEDERFKVLTENLGRAFYNTDSVILRDHDPEEPSPNFVEINQKRKELMVAGEEIFPYIGSYKGLIGALKFFGYQDLRIKEYWLNLNYKNVKLESPLQKNKTFLNEIKFQESTGYSQSYTVGDVLDNENSGKYKLTQTYGPDKKGNYVLNVTSENTLLPSKTYKKTSLFGLYYDLNKVTDSIDEYNYPVVVDAFKFTQEEVLLKIFALKERLKRDYLPLNARIIDITGEGIYFMVNNTRSWTDKMERSDINIGFNYDFFPNPDFGFIEDLRNFNIRPNPSDIQSPSSYYNDYSTTVSFIGGTGSAIAFTSLPNGATGSNPTLSLVSGKSYKFIINDPTSYGYDFIITKTQGVIDTPYGVVNNGATGGGEVSFYVNPEQTSPLYYYSSQNPSLLKGVINILPSTVSDLGNTINPIQNNQNYTAGENVKLIESIGNFYNLKQNGEIVDLGDGRFDPSAYIDPVTGSKFKTPIGMPVVLEILVDQWTWNEMNMAWTGLSLPTFKVGDRVHIKPVPANLSAVIFGGSVVAINVNDGGQGYNYVPTVTISGGGGSGASFSPVMLDTSISYLNSYSGGSGYTTTPNIQISTNYGDFGTVVDVSYSTGVYHVLVDSTGVTSTFETSQLYATTQAYFQLNWANIDFSNIIEIEWILDKSATQSGSPYHFEFRGPIVDFYKLAHFLPYTGEYRVTCNTYDAFNAKTSVIRNSAIVVEPKTVDIDSWTRYREVETYEWMNVSRGWDDYDSMWEFPAEGQKKSDLDKTIPREILDFATYGNKSVDGQSVYVRTSTSQIGATGAIELVQNIIYIQEIYSIQNGGAGSGQYGYATIITYSPHNLMTGDGVTLSGSLPQINGRWKAIVQDEYTFRIQIVLDSSWSGTILENSPDRIAVDTSIYTNQRISGAGKIEVFVGGRLIGSAETGDSLYNTANQLTSSINSLITYPDYYASCVNPQETPVSIMIAAPGDLGNQQNGVPLTVNVDGSLSISSITPFLSGGVSPTENYVFWDEDHPDYPNDNLKYWGTKRLDWEVFTDSTWENGYAHTWFDYEFNNDWLGGYELHNILPGDHLKITTANTTYPFPVGVTFGGSTLTLQQVADQLNSSTDPNITNFYYRPIPSDSGNLSSHTGPINISVVYAPLTNSAYPAPPSLIGGSALLTVNFGYTGGYNITTTTTTTSTTTTSSTTTTTTLPPPPFTTTTTTTSTTTTTTTTTAPPDCSLPGGTAVVQYVPPTTTTSTTTTTTTAPGFTITNGTVSASAPANGTQPAQTKTYTVNVWGASHTFHLHLSRTSGAGTLTAYWYINSSVISVSLTSGSSIDSTSITLSPGTYTFPYGLQLTAYSTPTTSCSGVVSITG